MVTAADLQTLSDATLELYSPDLKMGNFADHAFRFLTKLTAADQVNFGDLDPKAGTLDATTNARTADWAGAVEGFGRFMAKYPLFCFDPTVNGGKPFFRNDFFSARQFRDLDIYSECFRILDAMNHAAVHVASDDGHVLFFALERAGRTDFTERDRILLDLAQTHLANARRLAAARQRMRPAGEFAPGTFCRAHFTPRESEVAYWLTQGKTNIEIAILLKVRLQTVKAHLTALFNKTGTGNRLALTLHVMDLGQSLSSGTHAWHQVKVHRH
jgi:DNA-binding CsgD family transcriptional regulator